MLTIAITFKSRHSMKSIINLDTLMLISRLLQLLSLDTGGFKTTISQIIKRLLSGKLNENFYKQLENLPGKVHFLTFVIRALSLDGCNGSDIILPIRTCSRYFYCH